MEQNDECINILDSLQDPKEINRVINYMDRVQKSIMRPKINDKDNNLTFRDLDNYIEDNLNKYDIIHDFIREFSFEYQQLFEPQESILRLFSIKKLLRLEILKDCKITFKNYGRGEVLDKYIDEPKNYLDMKLKDMGDISDLTFIDEINKRIIVITSKNYNDYSGKGKKFDLAKIKRVFEDKYESSNYKLVTIILVRDKNEVNSAIQKMSFSSKDSKILVENSILIDWDDLNKSYRKYKFGYDIPLHLNLFKKNKIKRFSRNWNLIDEEFCKNIDEESEKLLERHPELKEYIKRYSPNEIKKFYNNYNEINLIKINGDFEEKLVCLLGKKVFVNEQLNAKVELNKNNIINRIKRYYRINSIVFIVNNEEDKRLVKKKYDEDDMKIYTVENYKKIKAGDILINLTDKNLQKFYKKLINNNICKFIIDENTKIKEWLGIKSIEEYMLIDGKITLKN